MKIYIDISKLIDSPYSKGSENSAVIDENPLVIQMARELELANPSSFLVSGYRGVGKTSLIVRIIENLPDNFLCVHINLAKYDGYQRLMKKIIRQLYLGYELGVKNGSIVDTGLLTDLRLLYDRTFNDIVHSNNTNSKAAIQTSNKVDFSIKKGLSILFTILTALNIRFNFLQSEILNYILFTAGIFWVCLGSYNFARSKTDDTTVTSDESRKSLYDDEIAEYHLINMLQSLKDRNLNVVVALDEIDKIQPYDEVGKIINDLKALLLSGYANFFIISGQSLFYEFEKSKSLDDQVISTLFSKNIHVAFLKYASLKKYCLSVLLDTNDKSNEVVNNFLDSVILKSGRIPRKVVNLLRSNISWEGTTPFIEILESDENQLEYEAKLLTALGNLMDNELPTITSNKVELDFFIAQVHLWISKMRMFESSNFLMSKIIDKPSYAGIYPSHYISKLEGISEMLTDKLTDFDLLGVRHNNEQEEGEPWYYWIFKEEAAVFELSDESIDEMGDEIQDDSSKVDRTVNSRFINQFIDLEVFARKLYIEVINAPSNPERTLHLRGIVEGLVKIGVLSSNWVTSTQFKELNETRNKLVHGMVVSQADIERIEKSSFTMVRLKSELLHDFCFFVIKNFLSDFKFSDKHRSGFDIFGESDRGLLLVDIKYYQSREMSIDQISEIINKYMNFSQTEARVAHLVVIYFSDAQFEPLNNVSTKFNNAIADRYPDYRNRLHIFNISLVEDRSVRDQIEGAIIELNKKNVMPDKSNIQLFTEVELRGIDDRIKERAKDEWPDDFEMQESLIKHQQEALAQLKSLNLDGLNEDVFKIISDKAKGEWPNDYVMQLSQFNAQKEAFINLQQDRPLDIPPAEFDSIINKAAREWPEDYVMQESVKKRQIESLRRLL